jgi:TPR repeat protein
MEEAVSLWSSKDDPYSKMWYGDWCSYRNQMKEARQLWTEAIPQLQAAAEAGDPRAQHELSGAYDRGHGGLLRDRALARHWSILAALQVGH